MIYPLKETRPNFHILTGIHVKNITFDEYVFQFSISPFMLRRARTAKPAPRALRSRRTRYSIEVI